MLLHPYWRKENQCVMNHQQSTSISGKQRTENLAGEGSSAIAQQDRVRGRAATTHPIVRVGSQAMTSPARGKLANADYGHRPTQRRNVAFLVAATAITSRPQK